VAADETYEVDIDVSGAEAESAAQKVARLHSELSRVGQSAKIATDAVKVANAAYADKAAAADRASKALEGINVRIEAQRQKMEAAMNAGEPRAFWRAATALEALNVKQQEAAARAASANAALADAAAKSDAMAAAAQRAAAAQDQLAAALKKAEATESAQAKTAALLKQQNDELVKAFLARQNKEVAAMKEAQKQRTKLATEQQKVQADLSKQQAGSGQVNEIAEGLGKLGGPLGRMGQQAFGAAEGFKKLSTSLGSAGPYAAIAVAIVAIVAGVIALAAAATIATAKVAAWAVSLADVARTQRLVAAGVAGTVAGGVELDATLDRLSSSVVPLTRDELLGMAADLRKAGFEGKALSAELEKTAIKAAKAKFGPDFQKQMLALPNQAARLKTNIAGIFGGLKIEKLLEGLARLVGLFDQTSVTGRAIKVIFESLFQPLIDGVVSWVPKLESAFIQFMILVMKGMIAIKPFGSEIMYVAKVFGVLAGIMALMAVGFTVAVIMPFAIIIGLAAIVVAAVMSVVQAFYDFWTKLQTMTLGEIGSQMILGLAQGITGSASAVFNAITGCVSGAIDGAKKLLGIASPSKVFAEIGSQTGAGMAGGVDNSVGDVQQSLAAMVNPPAPSASSPAPAAAASSGEGGSGGSKYEFVFHGVAGAEDAYERFVAFCEAGGVQAGTVVP